MRRSILALLVLLSSNAIAQCSADLSFCWTGDQVEVFGDHWISQAAREKSLEYNSSVRCVKSLNLCVYANSREFMGRRVTKSELYSVTKWDNLQVQAESMEGDACEIDSVILNRAAESAVLLTAPGPKANEPGCKGVLGSPRTVVYELKRAK
jgi:hypothetical protein